MSSAGRRILLTAALPYANGSIHIGHLVEYLQADFWTRFQKMRGHECHYVCADDTHGTPIMVEARKRGITPEQLIEKAWQEHFKDFEDFQVQFSHYSSTNSAENKKLCEDFFAKMRDKKHIHTKNIDQLYCEHDKMFLPDRFVKGVCPKCSAKDQYGDSCDVCGSTYSPTELKDSYCAICSSKPVTRQSEQLLFRLNDFKSYLEKWIPEHAPKEVSNKMLEWFNEDLHDWDISRNAPYFGFEIPGHPQKYFYVWVDAPMGYIASSEQLFKKLGLNVEQSLKEYWREDSKTEVYHFIGKDIIRFHTLFWPALLKTAEFRSPTKIFVHGHLMINGEKMSKSKGTMINARTYLNHLDPMYLRYYYATKLSSAVDDLDLNLEDFSQRVNAELIGKITNLASRGAQMLSKKFGGLIATLDADGEKVLKLAQKSAEEIATHYENRDFLKATALIRSLAEEGNRYFDEKAPWKTVDTDPANTHKVLSVTLLIFRCLAIYLKPILPVYAEKIEKLMNEQSYSWADSQKVLSNHKINDYEHLATRIDPVKVKAMLEESQRQWSAKMENKPSTATTSTAPAPAPAAATPTHISIDDFSKIDLRIAKIVEANHVEGADKLLRLKVDLGALGERQIFAGIKSAYAPEALVGRLTVVVANLAPRKMKFGMSEGMVLAASDENATGAKELFIMSPDAGAKPGDKVK